MRMQARPCEPYDEASYVCPSFWEQATALFRDRAAAGMDCPVRLTTQEGAAPVHMRANVVPEVTERADQSDAASATMRSRRSVMRAMRQAPSSSAYVSS